MHFVRGTNPPSRKRIVCRILIVTTLVCAFFMASCSAAFLVVFRRMPPPELGAAPTYAALDSAVYPREEQFFLSGENTLSGCWFPAENPVGTVLIVHGLGSSGEAHLPETMFFLDHGFSVFTYDATGMGSSEGDSIISLSQSKWDVISAVDCLRRIQPDGPLFLYGHSMGGYGVLAALPEIEADGAVCINGFRTPLSMMHGSAKQRVGILADLSYPFLALQYRLCFGREGNADAMEAAIDAEVPVLILNARDDNVVPEQARLSTDGAYEHISVRTVDGGHTGIWLAEDLQSVNEPLMDTIAAFYLSVFEKSTS